MKTNIKIINVPALLEYAKINTTICKSSSYIYYTTGIFLKIKGNKIGGKPGAIFQGLNTEESSLLG